MSEGGFYMDANKYRTAYDKAQAVQHEVWTELCQHLEHAPDAQLLSDYTATLVYTLDKDRREEALRLLRGQLYSRQLRDTGRVESWFTDCGARMGQDIEGFVANASAPKPKPNRRPGTGGSASVPPAPLRRSAPPIWCSPTCPGAW